MELVTTKITVRLTGLSTEQLREWTSRRALISPDIPPKGRGSSARYSWQTILMLRLAVALHDSFKLELEAHRQLFADIGGRLREMPFSSLWGKALALRAGGGWTLLERELLPTESGDLVVLGLDAHLKILTTVFSRFRPNMAEQLELFSTSRSIVSAPSNALVTERKSPDIEFVEPLRRFR